MSTPLIPIEGKARLSYLAKVAAVIFLSLMPFGVSVGFAYVAWEVVSGLGTLFRLVAIALVWIAAFAAGTLVFWKATGLFVPRQR